MKDLFIATAIIIAIQLLGWMPMVVSIVVWALLIAGIGKILKKIY
jgi:hypothetical protein